MSQRRHTCRWSWALACTHKGASQLCCLRDSTASPCCTPESSRHSDSLAERRESRRGEHESWQSLSVCVCVTAACLPVAISTANALAESLQHMLIAC